jgi:hypothetical protein
LDWNSFWTGVAAAVVAGLILFVLVEGPRWYRRRRRRLDEEAERRQIERMPISVAGPIVAEELRRNAVVSKRYEMAGPHGPTEARQLEVDAWRERRVDLAGLAGEDPDLWAELQAAYERLQWNKKDATRPPDANYLLALANPLERAARG